MERYRRVAWVSLLLLVVLYVLYKSLKKVMRKVKDGLKVYIRSLVKQLEDMNTEAIRQKQQRRPPMNGNGLFNPDDFNLN